MRTITYYYAPISGFAYLGERRLMEIARRAGAEVAFRPIDIQRIFQAAETVPPGKQPQARLSYRLMDLKRQAERLGLPINPKPKHWPVPAGLAARLIYATGALGQPQHPLSFAILSAVYAGEKDISDPDTLKKILTDLGLDVEAHFEMAETPDIADRFEAGNEAAIAAGVFGSPTYVLDGEMFFGQDRLDLLAWRLGVTDPLCES